jgi:hypothetical protein
MKIFEYLSPENPVAQGIVYVLVGLFILWAVMLLWSLLKNRYYSSQIKRNEDAASLLIQEPTVRDGENTSALSSTLEAEKVFRAFQQAKGLKDNSPIAGHLRAIFDAGWHESQLDSRVLIKNTTDKLFRANTLHRALLSIFIIIGLLGTLFGLADTMASLDTLLHGGTQLTNDTLGQGLQRLLGTLKGAFAPSILGVLMTVSGVFLFALYLHFVALPLGNLLERMTLTVWIPQLVPTASQKLQDKLQLSKQQVERSLAAADKVGDFIQGIEHKTDAFSETLGVTTEALKQMGRVASHLGAFSQNFVEGVKALTPFQQDLRALYQQMANESRAFQESVQRNITGAEDFQRRIQDQLNNQNQQLAQVLDALQHYVQAYIANSGEIDKKLSVVLEKADRAFENLSKRNAEITQALDEALGKPLRENLAQHLGAVESTLQTQLGAMGSALEVQLRSMGDRLRGLDEPLNNAADKFENTFINFNAQTDEWRESLQRTFIKQNDISQEQLQRLELLNQQLPALLQQLSASSSNFSESSSSFAARGQQLGEDVNALSQNVASLSRSVDVLGEQVIKQPGGNDPSTELLAQQTKILQELTRRLEQLAASQRQSRQVSVIASNKAIAPDRPAPPKPRLGRRLSDWFWYGRW